MAHAPPLDLRASTRGGTAGDTSASTDAGTSTDAGAWSDPRATAPTAAGSGDHEINLRKQQWGPALGGPAPPRTRPDPTTSNTEDHMATSRPGRQLHAGAWA